MLDFAALILNHTSTNYNSLLQHTRLEDQAGGRWSGAIGYWSASLWRYCPSCSVALSRVVYFWSMVNIYCPIYQSEHEQSGLPTTHPSGQQSKPVALWTFHAYVYHEKKQNTKFNLKVGRNSNITTMSLRIRISENRLQRKIHWWNRLTDQWDSKEVWKH